MTREKFGITLMIIAIILVITGILIVLNGCGYTKCDCEECMIKLAESEKDESEECEECEECAECVCADPNSATDPSAQIDPNEKWIQIAFAKKPCRAVAISKSDPNIIYVGVGFAPTQEGLWISKDAGRTWEQSSITDAEISDIEFSIKDPQTLCVAAWGDGIFTSSNSGESYKQIDLVGTVFNYVGTITFDTSDPNGNTWYATTMGVGVWKTNNNWETAKNVLPDVDSVFNAVDIASDGTIAVYTIDGYANISTDGGYNWEKHSIAVGAGIAFSDPNTIYCGDYYSTDKGQTWIDIPVDIIEIQGYYSDSTTDTFALTYEDGLKLYNGEKWLQYNKGLSGEGLVVWSMDRGKNFDVIGTNNGVYIRLR